MQVCDKCKIYGLKADERATIELFDCKDECMREFDFYLCVECYKKYQSILRKFFGVKKKDKRK